MTKFILIRHGYSEFNHLKKFAGQLDVALISLLERKFEKTRFSRVDSDIVERLIVKEEQKFSTLGEKEREVLTGGATDVGTIHLTRGGVPSGVISIPCRYIHSPASVCALADVENQYNLVKAFLDEGGEF